MDDRCMEVAVKTAEGVTMVAGVAGRRIQAGNWVATVVAAERVGDRPSSRPS